MTGSMTSIFQNLLGRTVVVEDIDCGIAIARRYGHRFRIVTLDGQVIHAGGSMTGGSVTPQRGRPVARERSSQRLQRKAGRGSQQQLHQAARSARRRRRATLKKAQYELDVAEEQHCARPKTPHADARGAQENQLRRADARRLEASCGQPARARAETIDRAHRRPTADRARRVLQETIDRCEREVQALRAEAGEKLAGQSELLDAQRRPVAEDYGA